MNNYYVYEWIRLDTNEPFYVGMGHGKRCYQLTRGNNNHFNNIVKSIPVAVNILHDNLDRQIAFDLEVWYIREYRDIIGYELVNISDGGEGCVLCGELNSFYGKHHSEETKRKISDSKKGKCLGKDNPFYGKHHTEESIEKISKAKKGRQVNKETKKKISIANKGENNYWYGKGELIKGKNSPRAKSVICLTTKRIFFTAKEGAEYYNCSPSSICYCCKKKSTKQGYIIKSSGKYKGECLVWRYLIWKHNKRYRIKKIIN